MDLPDAKSPPMQQNVEPLVVSIKADGSIYLQKHTIEIKQLAPRIAAMRRENPSLPVFIRGDSKTPYGRVAEVMSLLEGADIRKVGLVTEPAR